MAIPLINTERRRLWREEMERIRKSWDQLTLETQTAHGEAGMLYEHNKWMFDRLEEALLSLDFLMGNEAQSEG